MTGTIIAAVLVASAIVILIFLKKRKRSPQKVGSAVPIVDADEIRDLKKHFHPKPKGKLTNSQLMQMAQVREQPSNIKIEPSRIEPAPKETRHFNEAAPAPSMVVPMPVNVDENLKTARWQKTQETIERLEQENLRLKEVLKRELSSKDAITLNEEEQKQLHQAKEDVTGTHESLQRLSAENQELRKQIEGERSHFEELDRKFSVFKAEFEHQKSIEWAKEETLQNQIVKLQEENRKLNETKGLMEQKKAELISLQAYQRDQEAKVSQWQVQVNELKESNHALLAQCKEAKENADRLKEDLEVVKLTYEQKISDATDRVLALQGIKEVKQEADLSAGEKSVLERIREQNDELLKANDVLNTELVKTKELSAQLREKEKILQYELTKARAQSVGLEKICEDFKEQIEQMSRVANGK